MRTRFPLTLEDSTTSPGLVVLRDDLIEGGTKRTYLWKVIASNPTVENFVYASPPEGGLQLALAALCKETGKNCVIVTQQHKTVGLHTRMVLEMGGSVLYVPPPNAFQKRLEKVAREYAVKTPHTHKLAFGGAYEFGVDTIAARMRKVSDTLGREPDEVFCAVGSGTLLRGILRGTDDAKVIGVLVGMTHKREEFADYRVTLIRHRLKYQQPSKFAMDFPCNVTYERKAFETMLQHRTQGALTLFWNVHR